MSENNGDYEINPQMEIAPVEMGYLCYNLKLRIWLVNNKIKVW